MNASNSFRDTVTLLEGIRKRGAIKRGGNDNTIQLLGKIVRHQTISAPSLAFALQRAL